MEKFPYHNSLSTHHFQIWSPPHKDSLLPSAGRTTLGSLPFPSRLSPFHARPDERLTARLHPDRLVFPQCSACLQAFNPLKKSVGVGGGGLRGIKERRVMSELPGLVSAGPLGRSMNATLLCVDILQSCSLLKTGSLCLLFFSLSLSLALSLFFFLFFHVGPYMFSNFPGFSSECSSNRSLLQLCLEN